MKSTLCIIICILVIHFILFNPFEKLLFYLYRENISVDIFRPTYNPHVQMEKGENSATFSNLGMPSGHTEITTIVLLLLCQWNVFSLPYSYSYPVALFLIFLMGMQRIQSHMHTPIQVLVGFLFGYVYFTIYAFLYSVHPGFVFLAILFYFFLLNTLILLKITKDDTDVSPSPFNNDPVIEKIKKLYAILIHRDCNLTDFL